ncbi:adenylate kinase [Emericellopsis atlantica]|uniref:GTP:AMP phosphotransferase, mitochondrial n=1 Tax=Emericellopsis atlantica TaxID=2614577 RepID=A0A9P8CPQ6_9HYPO|nr:adenylate kinase [Emericellopsis atlantica]KAG9254803.1 adenylate kinase [Emericellopsis atlantica]
MRLKRAARVILIGAPGVGKGTQTERLLARFPQLQSISTGDVLRSNVKRRTALGIKAEGVIKSGGLVDDSTMLRLISNELRTRGWLDSSAPMTLSASPIHSDDGLGQEPAYAPPSEDPSASFILDGYPRTPGQATTLDQIVPINLAVSLVTPFSVILDRIAGRWVHEPSGRVYNTSFHAPKVAGHDDVTGEPLVQRPDDKHEVYSERLRKFQETSEPLLEHYAKKGVLVEVEGLSSDEITPKLFEEFEKRFVQRS